ncbi:thiol-disulfide isomerase/thioredoxin [Actinoalloteichus hoggarensis]|nr:NHL domain-containing thioredoxin family protein [Actinoalloteichus hoggarensis]MBB5922638.1 thiol-disulfide isomerase/thioredoxin [Actinoalloteichus hoggarensis]
MAVSNLRRSRVRAPELVGRGWLNTGGESYSIKDFRGRITILDFWTFCCINCLHVLDELRPLEEEFSDVLVTIGVHSPKFVHEADPAALAAAVERYEVTHPVLDDPELITWQAHAVRAWPTLVVIDPEGYVVHVAAGEGHIEALRAVILELIAEHESKGTLHRGEGPYVAPEPAETTLRFPSKAIATAAGTLLVADTRHHRVVELDADGETVLREIGRGTRGDRDGDPVEAEFSEPSGLALLPEDVAAEVGYHLVVADTVNHTLRGVDLATGRVRTVAGTGEQWRSGVDAGPGTEIPLTSPTDVAWWGPADAVIIAMAGNHTLGAFDPRRGTVARFAGTTVEGLSDGPAADAFLAQPSGLAATDDRLWFVDSETSALRWVGVEDGGFVVRTAVGTGLFDFGHRDGPAAQALLQHPLGVTALADGSLAVADTYNGAVRRYDPVDDSVSTLVDGLAEPSGAVLLDGELVVVSSAAHRVDRPVPPGIAATLVAGAAHQVRRPPSELASGAVELAVIFTPPPGQKLDERYGPSTRVEITSSPPELLVSGAGVDTSLTRQLVIADDIEGGVLHVVAQAAACDDDPAVEHPACRLARQDWGIPIRVTPTGAARLPLMMGGLDHAG